MGGIRPYAPHQEDMPAATRQQADDEERAATAVALGEAQGQAEQVVAAEQAAKDALELESSSRWQNQSCLQSQSIMLSSKNLG